MGTYSSYYLYQKYQIIGNQDPVPVIPLTYSVSGDTLDPQPLVLKLENDPKCGYVPPVEYQYRDIESGYTCVDFDKYTKIVRQRSSDGIHWENVSYSAGTLIEHNSTDCGYVGELYRWVNSGTTCYDGDKYIRLIQQVSYDGINWTNTGEEARGTMIEEHSDDCNDYPNEYLTFIPISGSSTFKFTKIGSGSNIKYSLDSGSTWSELSSNTASPIVNEGEKIMWKASLTPKGASSDWPFGIGAFSSTGIFKVECNAMSLLFEDNFIGKTDLTGKECAFFSLFSGCTKLVSAENLVLPATTLASQCYEGMFFDCTSLTTAPELPATTLTDGCYHDMFLCCASLTEAPDLPATTLAHSCYYTMFSGCTSLTTAPQLPATTMANYCYDGMFQRCTSLTTAPELPATTLADGCYSGMFIGCTLLTTAPELPAATLANSCYSNMFRGCTNLNYIKCLATSITATSCTYQWVDGVAANGTFTKAASMTSWTTGNSGIPNNWTIVNA